AAALERGAVVLPMEALEGVEEEGLPPLAVVLVRREDAGGEEGLGDDGGIAAAFRLVQGLVERPAGVIPPMEFHERVAGPHEGDRAHRAGFRILGGTEGREEFRICVEGLLPPLIVLSLVAFVKRLCNGLAGIRHRRTYAALPISPFACLPRRVWRFSRPQRGSARSP